MFRSHGRGRRYPSTVEWLPPWPMRRTWCPPRGGCWTLPLFFLGRSPDPPDSSALALSIS